MTHADKRMNPIHFGSDPADIQVRINPEIGIQILDQILALTESVLSECSCWNCSHFPVLSRCQNYLSASATNLASKQLFSAAGQIYSNRHSSLSEDNAEKLHFLVTTSDCLIIITIEHRSR